MIVVLARVMRSQISWSNAKFWVFVWRSLQKISFFAFLERRIMDNGSNQTEEGKREHRYHLNFRSWFARALVILFCDVLSTFFAFFMALYIRYDFKFKDIDPMYLEWMMYLVPLWCLFTFVVFYAFRLYHSTGSHCNQVCMKNIIIRILSYFIPFICPVFMDTSYEDACNVLCIRNVICISSSCLYQILLQNPQKIP